jgi:hypothetical protein
LKRIVDINPELVVRAVNYFSYRYWNNWLGDSLYISPKYMA